MAGERCRRRVLTIYAHHNPRSFCHAVLEQFDAGLRDAGHRNEVVDLYANGFNPVLGDQDAPSWIDHSVPDDMLARMQVRRSMLQSTRNPLRRLLVKRWMGFAFGMTAGAWRAEFAGRLPLLRHEQALIIQTTIWNEASYDEAGLNTAMKRLIDDYAMRYPGIQRLEHAYFRAVHGADDASRAEWLERAYRLGREF